MLTSLLRDENNRFLVVEDIEAISDIVQSRDRLLWLDLERPSLAEFRLIRDEFGLHPLAIEDAMARHPRPKLDQYDHFYLMVFYLVSVAGSDSVASFAGGNGHSTNSTGIFRPGIDGGPEFHSLRALSRNTPPSATVQGGTPQASSVRPGPATGLSDGLPMSDAASSMSANPTSDRILLRELTLFMGENYLITVHNSPMPELTEVARRWRQNVALIRPGRAATMQQTVVPGCRPLTDAEWANLQTHVGLAPNPLTPPSGAISTVTHARPSADDPPAGSARTRRGGVYRRSGNGRDGRDGRHGEIGILLYSLLDTVVDNYFPVVDSIVDRVEDLETEIFERFNQQAIESIFSLKKDLLGLRKVLAPERDVLNILVRRDLPIFDQQTLLYFQDLYDHIVRITDSVDTYRDLLSSALDSYLSMQSNRLNITVQTLTSLSIILMSVAAVTGWYGMNFAAMPELTSRLGYPGVVLAVALVVLAEVIFFKRKGWL